MSKSGKILVVDDEPMNVLLLKELLGTMGHEVTGAENGIVALELLDRSFDLVLSDVLMPVMDGLAMVKKIRNNPETRDIPVIMVTTLSDKADRLEAVRAGANDFITKPVDMVELQVRTASMLTLKAHHDEIKAFQEELNGMVELRTLELRDALGQLDHAHRETIHRLSAAAEYKDEETGMHILRMSSYSELIAGAMNLDKTEVALIRTSSPMHDIGKIGIPDGILLKPGKLTPGEWETMKTHTLIGKKILDNGKSDYLLKGSCIAFSHHEKWDGSGYPQGLSGTDIPLAGRICAVADVFDALTSHRPYKKAFPVEHSLDIMTQGRGSHFDPEILDVFLARIDHVLAIRRRYTDMSAQ
ncbi:MAG: HD domain-containing phosphohydrolase [Pseudomonadota bacterium]